MHQFLQDAVGILAAAIVVVLVSNRLRMPSIVGFLLTGMLIGPAGLGLVGDVDRVELFAEIGVVFLLFAIGLEFSLERLKQIRRFFFLGGTLQALFTMAATTGLAFLAGVDPRQAVFLGFLVTLSSTAIVLKLYADRRELEAPQGKVLIGILLFQDFLIVPMIVLVPVLAGSVQASAGAIAGRFLLSLVAVGAVFAVARYLMPRLLHLLVRTRAREVLVLGALLVCLGLAWLTESLEFSLALGAFIAGIIISESEYSHQIVAEITPFRDVFNSLFFISVGMLLDLRFALAHAPLVFGLAAVVILVKIAASGGAVAALGFPRRIDTIVAFGLAQVGEFSFVLLKVGRDHALMADDLYQSAIAAAVLTMLFAPVLVQIAPRVGSWGRRQDAVGPEAGAMAAMSAMSAASSGHAGRPGHVVVVGYGVNGRNLTRVLRAASIRYVVVELDSELVRQARGAGEPVQYGDATRWEILEHAGIARASVVVFAISDRDAVRRAIRLARQLNPNLHIIVRTLLVGDIEDLRHCGADEVIAQEFETSIEIFTRVLRHFRVPGNIVRAEIRALRGEGYRMMRSPSTEGLTDSLLQILEAGTTDVFRLADDSPAVGRSLSELDLRRVSGVMVIAVVRGGKAYPNPEPDLRLERGDDLVLVGSHAEIDRAYGVLEPASPGTDETTPPAPPVSGPPAPPVSGEVPAETHPRPASSTH